MTEKMRIRFPLDNAGLPATWLAAIGAGALAVENAEASGRRALQGWVRGGGDRVRRRRVRAARRGE